MPVVCHKYLPRAYWLSGYEPDNNNETSWLSTPPDYNLFDRAKEISMGRGFANAMQCNMQLILLCGSDALAPIQYSETCL